MHDGDVREEPPEAGGGTLGVLALAAAAFALAQTAIVPGLTDLTRALNTSTANVSWVLSGYLVSAAIFTPIMGRLGDMFGKRRMLIVSLLFFAGGSVLAALSGSIWSWSRPASSRASAVGSSRCASASSATPFPAIGVPARWA